MTRSSRAALVAVALGAFAGPAFAQIQTLPETSRAQGQANAINNSLVTQSQNRAIQQQNQTEINTLRNTPTVQPVAPPPVVAPPVTR